MSKGKRQKTPLVTGYSYRGFEVHCTREQSLGGDEMTYYQIIDSEGVFVVDTFTSDMTPFKEFALGLKGTVDDILENPGSYYED